MSVGRARQLASDAEPFRYYMGWDSHEIIAHEVAFHLYSEKFFLSKNRKRYCTIYRTTCFISNGCKCFYRK